MSGQPAKTTWRSLGEYADTAEFRRWAETEFPALAAELERAKALGSPTRRRFLQLMGASMALAGLNGCRRRPDSRILPFGDKPAEMAPGLPLYYATSLVAAGHPVGVLAETHEGRPTKLEGNPRHPASHGALGAHAQAAVLELYDPDRSRFVTRDGRPVDPDKDLLPALDAIRDRLRSDAGGRGLAVLTGRTWSPAVETLRARMRATLPNATWHVWEPLELDGGRAPLPWSARPDLEGARVVLSLDCDLLGLEDAGVRHRRAFARGRGGEPGDPMNRLYVVEPHLTVTGATADHRLALPAHRIRDYALLLARAVAGGPGKVPELDRMIETTRASFDGDTRWIEAVVADLRAEPRRAVVVAGRRQPAAVHAAVRWINEYLGGPVEHKARAPERTILDLADRIGKGEVDTLVVLGCNPVYDAPADLGFDRLLERVGTTIHVGLFRDETGSRCTWHVPEAHALESWGDTLDGDAYAPVQPMIEPLLGGRSRLEILARLAGADTTDPYAIVKESFASLTGSDDLDARWRRWLHEGHVRVARLRDPAPPFEWSVVGEVAPNAVPGDTFELVFSGDESVFDGRYANHAWLQECPDPITKLVWDNAAIVSPATARALGASNGDFLAVTIDGRTLDLPAFIVPGGAEASLRLPLGYGRREAGALGRHAGFDTYRLRTAATAGFATGATVRRIEGRHELATTQEHWSIESHELLDGVLAERAIVREGTRQHFEEEPDFAAHMGLHVPHHEDIQTRPEFTGEHQWGMVIDLNRCIGCTACTVACQAENNIPVVGPDEVRRGREMHWIRIDRYFRGPDPYGPVEVSNQPMLCQHCENAPCEPVCPVNATVHDEDGLNVMAYNRCIGTRYCSNNCPYKVRRFNWFDWNKDTLRESDAPFDQFNEPTPFAGFSEPQAFQPPLAELLKMQKNPDVTVRMRGVMEKCTFCTQRIQAAKIGAKVEAGQSPAGKVADGTLRTACQQTCPTEAIAFGDLSDPESRVSRLRRQPRQYAVLEHLNTRPRTTYLARLRNRNPAMPEPVRSAGANEEHHG